MRGEEITSCKSHIAPDSLTDWCMIFFFKLKKLKKEGSNKHPFAASPGNMTVMCVNVLYTQWPITLASPYCPHIYVDAMDSHILWGMPKQFMEISIFDFLRIE